MRRFIAILLAAAVFSAGASAQTGKSFYKKYSKEPGIETVYISPVMFKMMGGVLKVAAAGDDDARMVLPLLKSFKSLYVIEGSAGAASDAIRNDIEKLVKRNDLELMMQSTESHSITEIYVRLEGEDLIKELIIYEIEDNGHIEFVCIEGKINMEDIENLIASQQ